VTPGHACFRSVVTTPTSRPLAHQALWLRWQEDEAAVVQQWLAAAQLAQVGMDRLVGTLELIEGARRFYLQLSSYLCATTPGLAMLLCCCSVGGHPAAC
jgi:hypothetical protein